MTGALLVAGSGHSLGSQDGVQLYLMRIVSQKALLCRLKPCVWIGRVDNQLYLDW